MPMKTISQKLFHLQGKLRSIELSRTISFLEKFPSQVLRRTRFRIPVIRIATIETQLERIKMLGVSERMDEYEKRKLVIFNQLNFLQLVTGIVVPFTLLVDDKQLSLSACFQSALPAFVSLLVLSLNRRCKYEAALISYFLLYPIVTSVIYMGGINLGTELFFVLYGILSVFFLQDIGQMLFSVGLSMVSYFVLSVVWKNYHYQLENTHFVFFLFNQVLAILFIFYGLYLVKRENTDYQFNILSKSRALHKKNIEIQQQKKEIADKADLLEKQTARLTESNAIKNKLFSVIAHDLKTPMYALRNLFQNVEQLDMPAEEIKAMIPDVMNDLNYTTGLMENLLQWAKSQMQVNATRPQMIDVAEMSGDVVKLLRLQARAKQITVQNKIKGKAVVYADRDMIHLVLRNLLSNAIKFTPQKGKIIVGATEMPSFVEIFVQDTGTGICKEALDKIRQNGFYTTKGTMNESGTGLGLMLCKEFVVKNGGHMYIESEPGNGSVFSFTLPMG